ARTSLGVDHFAAQDQRALPALHDDDINHVVMLLWKSIRVPIKHSEAVIAVVRQRFPRGVIRTGLLGWSLFSLFQFGRLPHGEPHGVRSQDRDNKKPSGEETDGGLHRRSSFDGARTPSGHCSASSSRRHGAAGFHFSTLRPSARVTPVSLPSTSTPGVPLVAGWPLTMTISTTLTVAVMQPCRRREGSASAPK